MEVMRSTTGGGTGTPVPSKLEQLLTAGTTGDRRSSRTEAASAAESSVPIVIASKSGPVAVPVPARRSSSGGGTLDKGVDLDLQTKGRDGDDGGNSSSTSSTAPPSDKYRNPRKRHLMDALTSGEDPATREDKVTEESAKRFMKSKGKSEGSTKGSGNNGAQDGPASLKVTPIRLKKYYPSAVQSAECEEFLVSLSEDKNAKSLEQNPKLTTHAGAEEGPNGNTAKDKVKSKSNLEHSGPGGIDTDQIEKLLSMPSPKSWSKTPRQRPRKQQCKECSKYFPTLNDLQNHMLTHSQVARPETEKPVAKPVRCMHCDKIFDLEANLEMHLKYTHKKALSQNGLAIENGVTDEDKTKTTKKPVTTEDVKSSSESEAVHLSESTTEVATKIPTTKVHPSDKRESSFTISLNIVRDGSSGERDQFPLPPLEGRHRIILRKNAKIPLTKIRVKPVKTSTIKKKHSTTTKANSKVKEVVTSTKNDDDQETPTTPTTTGRTALRRNIQRPKWLSDSDLVTDYEFPRGTNTMRGNSISGSPSASSSTSSIVTGAKTAKSETRRSTSIEATNEKPSAPAADTKKADKPASRPSRESKNSKKEESNMVEKTASPKTSKVTKTKKETKLRPASKGASPVSQPVPNTRRKDKGQADGLPKLNSPSVTASPTQQLQAQILTLSLTTLSNNPVGKNVRKRMSTDAGVADLSQNAEKKVKKSDSTITSLESESKSITPSQKEKSPSKQQQTNQSEDDVEKVEKPKDKAQKGKGKKSAKVILKKRKLVVVTVAEPYKKLDPVIPPIVLAAERPSNAKVEPGNTGKTSDQLHDGKNSVNVSVVKSEMPESKDPDVTNVSGNASTSTDNNQACIMNEEQGNEQLTTTSSLPFANCAGVTFADIAERNSEIEASKELNLKRDHEAVFGTQRQVTSESMKVVESGGGTEKSLVDNGTAPGTNLPDILPEPLPTISNDEEMPILKPETTSTTVVGPGTEVVSCPISNQPKSIDEEETSNSTHSATPYEAPVLSKESGSAIANTEKGESSMPAPANSATDDNHQDSIAMETDVNTSNPPNDNDLDELPFDDEDNEIVRPRRDRSDSMSMRSCGSGTPSEKLKALDDTNTIVSTKDKETNVLSDNECLGNESDSESNDTLMSEFSELAAQVSENTDAAKFKEDCLRFMSTKISANSMWAIRKELKLLKRNKNYFKFGKLSPLAAGLMHDIFCQSLE